MDKKLYYVDTCIWLNLWLKEVSESGMPHGEIAKNFFKEIELCQDAQIFISTIVIKEIAFVLEEDYSKREHIFRRIPYITIIKTNNEDYRIARFIEKNEQYVLGFGDCLHIALTKRLGVLLVTRDKALLELGKKYVFTNKPEELL